MFTSLRSRLWLTYAVVIGAVLATVGVALMVYLLRNPLDPLLTRSTFQQVRILSLLIQRRAETLDKLSLNQLEAAFKRADREFNIRVAVLDHEGQVVVDSRAGQAPPLPAIPGAAGGRRLAEQWFRDSQGQAWVYDTRTLPDGYTLLVAAPRLRVPLARLILGDDSILRPLINAGLIALLLSLFLSFWIARWVAAPLQRMILGAQAIAAGKHNPIPLAGPSEVQELAHAFNEMSERVQASQQAQRDFVASVSHDLKTPLTSIQGFARAILDGTADSPEALQQAVGVIETEAGRMHRLVMDLLDLARLEAGIADFRSEPVDPAALLRGLREKMLPQAERAQVELKLDLEESLAKLTGDGDRIAQVFANLLDNALKFTPAGGRVVVSARSSGQQMILSVEDNGPGIPPEEIGRVFERFYQVDKSRHGGDRRGTGLGLAIAREIVEAHQGEISAQSQLGRGTVFVVRLPIQQADDQGSTRPKAGGTMPEPSKNRT